MDYLIKILLGLSGFVVGLVVDRFLLSYFSKKGENLATKEDIGKITHEIEKTRLVYSKELEGLKSSLASKLHINQTRYSNEYKLLEELTEKLVVLRDAALGLRPIMDYAIQGESDDERKQRRLEAFEKAIVDFNRIKEKKMPFYPKVIYEKLSNFNVLAWREVVDYKNGSPVVNEDYWKKAEENSESIENETNGLIELIRERIQKWKHDE